MIRSLTSNQYVIRNGKLQIKNKDNKQNTNHNNTIRFLTPLKKQIQSISLTQQKKQSNNNNPQNTTTINDEVSNSNYRYIPYQHTVRKIGMKDYYDTTIAKQKKEIQYYKDKYKQLMTQYHNTNLTAFQKENLQKIEEALLLNQPSRVRRIYDLSKSQIMIQPFSLGTAHTNLNNQNDSLHHQYNTQTNTLKNSRYNKCSWDQTPMRSLMKQSSIIQSQVICGRQVINEKQYLTPKLITKSIIFKNLEDQYDNRINQNAQSYLLYSSKGETNKCQNQNQQHNLDEVQVPNVQIYNKNNQRKFSKHTQNKRTRETQQSYVSVKSNRDSSRQKDSTEVRKGDFLDIDKHKPSAAKLKHVRVNSIIVNNKNQQFQIKQQSGQDDESQGINEPLTQRNQIVQNQNNGIPDFSGIANTKNGFQLLLNKTIEEHQQLKELFELYKISSEDRVKQLQQNFQEELNQMQESYKKQKQNCQKYCKKVKKYKKQLQQKQQIILDLIQKLRHYMKENEKIKQQQRKKALSQFLKIMKQKQLQSMIKNNKIINNIQQGRNIILSVINFLIECKMQKQIQSGKSLKDIQVLGIHKKINQ